MDFDFSDEQKAFRDAVRDVVERECPPEVVRRLGDDAIGFEPGLWETIVGLGWPGLLIGEEHGGLGGDLVDAVVLQEELGRAAAPVPYFSSALFATIAARRLGAEELLADLAAGASRGTVAIDETSAQDPVAGIASRARAEGDGWVLDGVKPLVPDAHLADWVIVAARTDGGIGAFLVERFEARPVPTLDPTRKFARLELSDTPARRLGDGDVTGELRRIMDDTAVLLCAELTGASERALELAREYASARVQFGRPIGSFQAIKHMAAEMLQKVELARVAPHYAAWASVNDTDDREQAAAMAKSWCAEAAIEVTGRSIQIHGAVGFTWECDAHFLYRRAKANDLLLGQQGWQRQRVADLVLGPVA